MIWHANSFIGYAYLSEVASEAVGWGREFQESRGFTRGWTLQELIAPRLLEFFANDWKTIGTKLERAKEIEGITGIPESILLREVSGQGNVAERLSWAAHRHVTREEDIAYSLMGLFNINMPMLYGEGGENAFRRLLQQVFLHFRDHTMFLHTTLT